MLNESIQAIAAQNGGRFEDMPAMLAADGIDYAAFRRSLRSDITVEQLRRIEVGQSINVTEREVAQCIADLEGNVVVNSEYELSHIRLSFAEDASAEEIREAEELANSIYQQLQEGADFRELAARHSAGDTALEEGGRLAECRAAQRGKADQGAPHPDNAERNY
jgi:peptidyl-prolyl cis-trans isomerase SurA